MFFLKIRLLFSENAKNLRTIEPHFFDKVKNIRASDRFYWLLKEKECKSSTNFADFQYETNKYNFVPSVQFRTKTDQIYDRESAPEKTHKMFVFVF